MIFGGLIFSGREWVLPAVALAVLALCGLAWNYFRANTDLRIRLLCFILKAAGIIALVLCLMEPLWSSQRVRPGANYFAILADNSQGMNIKDNGQAESRGEKLRTVLLSDQSPWQQKIESDFQLRRYLFDSRLQSTRDFNELNFEGRSSALISSLHNLAGRFHGQPLAGILLLSDGNATDLGDALPDLSGLPPVYPVVMGEDSAIKDVALQKASVSQTIFEDAPVTIQAEVVQSGYTGEPLAAHLYLIQAGSPAVAGGITNGTNASVPLLGDASSTMEKLVAKQVQKAGADGKVTTFRFETKPDRPGINFYRVRVGPETELASGAAAPSSTEATLANNGRIVAVDRGKGPYRILYVTGRPNWEFKFLNRALSEDDQIQLSALIRIAKREPKFEFKGRSGETSNPLFRGFDRKTEETERYDQPVLIRLNVKDATELQSGFPKTAEDLYGFHAVIIDDLESEFFTFDQLTLLKKYVSERGAGFMMLGGQESFRDGNYHSGPVQDLLPVYLDKVDEVKPGSGTWRMQLTREGGLQAWARLRSTESEERSRLEAMPPFQVMNQPRGIKPGAMVIASVADDQGKEHPAVVVQRFGYGRSASVLIGDWWRWGLQNESLRADMEKAWRQLVRWLIADVPKSLDFQAEPKPGDPNQALSLRLRVRDKEFKPLDNATVTMVVESMTHASSTGGGSLSESNNLAGSAIRLQAEPVLNEPGVYEATYVPREIGGYRATASVVDPNGNELGQAEVGWSSDSDAEEFRNLKPNRALLETIAKRTGGEVIKIGSLNDLAQNLPRRQAPITEAWNSPVWHTPAVFLFALVCLVSEWGIRRMKGLA